MFAFVHIEKTAGSSLVDVLRRSFGLAHCDVEPLRGYWALPFGARDYRWLRLLHPPLRSIAGHTVTPYSDLETVRPDVRYYTFLREPIVRQASHYQHNRQQLGRSRPFEEWIRLPHHRNHMCSMIAGEESADAAIEMIRRKRIFVGLIEEFDASLRELDVWMGGVLCLDYEVRNVAPGQSIKQSLLDDPASRELIEDANREDVRLYRWATESWVPEQRERLAGAAVASRAPGGAAGDLRLRLARLHRNVVYKPALRAIRWWVGEESSLIGPAPGPARP